eukprot:gene21256-23329_t
MRTRDVGPGLVQLCVRLLRGTFKEIATAVWKNEKLKEQLIALFPKEIDKECRGLCSAKNPSILRKTSNSDLLNFDYADINKELTDRSPLLRNVLMSASTRKRKIEAEEGKDSDHLFWLLSGKLTDIDPAVFCMSEADHAGQRQNYVDLVSRIQVNEIKCLEFLKDVVSKHIPHKSMSEMSQPTDEVILPGNDFCKRNETSSEGMALADLYKYVSTFGEGESRICGTQGVMADQLSVENAINIQFQAANAFDPAESFDGMHFEIGDFHTEMKFMQVYSVKVFGRVLCMRVLLKLVLISTFKLSFQRFSACKSFLLIELEARIVTCTLEVLKIQTADELPEEMALPHSLHDASNSAKEKFAQNLAAKVVDKYIISSSKIEKFMVQKKVASEQVTFKCQSPNCNKQFKTNGKQKQNHELKAHGIQTSLTGSQQSKDGSDDIYNYQTSFLEFGMILKNFFDAVKEGDGDRIIQCWKFMLPYLKADGASKSGQGGNIPMDLGMEHYIRIMKIIIRNIGSNARNPKILQRYANPLSFSKKLMVKYDSMSLVIQRSGKHVKESAKEDLKKIVSELMEQKAFHFTPGRTYSHYRGVPDSLLHNLDIRELYSWINEHKKKISQRQTAR